MTDYVVSVSRELSERYAITADSAREARENWSEGKLIVSDEEWADVTSVLELP